MQFKALPTSVPTTPKTDEKQTPKPVRDGVVEDPANIVGKFQITYKNNIITNIEMKEFLSFLLSFLRNVFLAFSFPPKSIESF